MEIENFCQILFWELTSACPLFSFLPRIKVNYSLIFVESTSCLNSPYLWSLATWHRSEHTTASSIKPTNWQFMLPQKIFPIHLQLIHFIDLVFQIEYDNQGCRNMRPWFEIHFSSHHNTFNFNYFCLRFLCWPTNKLTEKRDNEVVSTEVISQMLYYNIIVWDISTDVW